MMHIATLLSRPGEVPVWKYQRESGDYLVKMITFDNDEKDFEIKTPDGVFYYFPAEVKKNELELLKMIESKEREIEKYIRPDIISIFD